MLYGDINLNYISRLNSEPQYEYKGFLFNYWDINDALYEQYKEELKDQQSDYTSDFTWIESHVDTYIADHISEYLEELLYTANIDIDFIYERSPLNFEYLKDALYDQYIEQDEEPHYPTDAETLDHYSGISFVPEDFC